MDDNQQPGGLLQGLSGMWSQATRAFEALPAALNPAPSQHQSSLPQIKQLGNKLARETLLIKELEATIETLNKMLQQCGNESAQLKRQVGDYRAERTDMVKEMVTLTADNNAMVTTIADLKQTHEADIGALNVKLEHQRNALSKLLSELVAAKADNKAMKEAGEQQQQELMHAQEQVADLTQLMDVYKHQLSTARQAQQEESQSYQGELAEFRVQYESELRRFDSELNAAKMMLDKATTEHAKSLAAQQQLVLELQAQIESQRSNHANEMDSCAARINELTHKIEALKADQVAVAARQQQEELQCNNEQYALARQAEECDGLKKQLKDAQQQLFKLAKVVSACNSRAASVQQYAAAKQEEAARCQADLAEFLVFHDKEQLKSKAQLAEARRLLAKANTEHGQLLNAQKQLVAELQAKVSSHSLTHSLYVEQHARHTLQLSKELDVARAGAAALKTLSHDQQVELKYAKQQIAEVEQDCADQIARFKLLLGLPSVHMETVYERHAEECSGLKKQLVDAVTQLIQVKCEAAGVRGALYQQMTQCESERAAHAEEVGRMNSQVQKLKLKRDQAILAQVAAKNDVEEHVLALHQCKQELARVSALLHSAQPTDQALMSIGEAKVKEAILQAEAQDASDEAWQITTIVAADSTLLSAGSVASSTGKGLLSVSSTVSDTSQATNTDEQ